METPRFNEACKLVRAEAAHAVARFTKNPQGREPKDVFTEEWLTLRSGGLKEAVVEDEKVFMTTRLKGLYEWAVRDILKKNLPDGYTMACPRCGNLVLMSCCHEGIDETAVPMTVSKARKLRLQRLRALSIELLSIVQTGDVTDATLECLKGLPYEIMANE